jgi:outer membrane protein assembly factor BamB
MLAVDVLTYHNNLARTGANLNETVLTTTNVRPATFGLKHVRGVDGQIYAQPLYVSGLVFPNNGHPVNRSVVYAATEHDSVYAFDAVTGARLWHATLLNTHFGETPVPADDTGSTDITPEIGITSTPVIDKATKTMYVVAKAKRVVNGSDQFIFRLFALDLITGLYKLGGPVTLSASVPGTGIDADNGVVRFNALREHQRPGLVLLDNIVYIAFASHGDIGPYHGWVLGYNATTLQRAKVWNVTPDGKEGGIWMTGAAPAVDSDGNLYINIGNGTTDAKDGGDDFGMSFVRIPTRGGAPFVPSDFFTPFNFQALNDDDLDLGSSGVLLLPDVPGAHPHQAIFGGKEGAIYLADRDNLGQFNSSDDDVLQRVGPFDHGPLFSTPAYFNNRVYIGAVLNQLASYRVHNDALEPTGQHSDQTFGYPGVTPSISANGGLNGIVWIISKNANGDAVLQAFPAGNLSQRIYTSEQLPTRDRSGGYVKFSVPTVADGKVFVGTSNQLAFYGRL